jgi:hypothetical protein
LKGAPFPADEEAQANGTLPKRLGDVMSDPVAVIRTRVRTALTALCASAILCACAGNPWSPLPIGNTVSSVQAGSAAPSHRHRARLRFRIQIPKRKKKRHEHYISPATLGMTLKLTGGPSSLNETIALTPSLNPHCSSSLAGTTCQFTVQLLAGNYLADISTFDAVACGGGTCHIPGTANELSTGQNVAVTMHGGVTNQANITLSGIPASLLVVPTSVMSVSDVGGYDLVGLGAHPFLIEALDADNNEIVGPGAPTYAVTEIGNVPVAIAGPTSPSPNAFTLTPPKQFTAGGSATVKITATYPAGATNACNFGGVCTASVPVAPREMLLVGNANGTVTGYPVGSSTPIVTLPTSGTVPSAIASDSSGNVFAAYQSNDTVFEFPAGSATVSRTITAGVAGPCCLVVDPTNSELFVANSSSNLVTVYAPGHTAAGLEFSITTPVAMLEDGNANIVMGGNQATAFLPPPFAGENVIGTGSPPCPPSGNGASALALDSAGVLFVASTTTLCGWPNTANGYSGSSIAVATSGVSTPRSIAVDASDNVYAVNTIGNDVTVYSPPYTGGNPAKTITDGITSPESLALDASGNLYVANGGANAVTVYATGTTTPSMTVSSGVNDPNVVYVEP